MTKKEHTEIEALKQELDEQKQQVAEYTDHLKRLQAEFDNYAKRVEKERGKLVEQASEHIILKLLNIMDDFERALPALDKAPDDVKQGVEMIYKNLHKVLTEEHVATIPTVGQPFDPFKHEVILKVDSDKAEDTIIEEVQRGYTLNGNVIRYAKVTVSKNQEVQK